MDCEWLASVRWRWDWLPTYVNRSGRKVCVYVLVLRLFLLLVRFVFSRFSAVPLKWVSRGKWICWRWWVEHGCFMWTYKAVCILKSGTNKYSELRINGYSIHFFMIPNDFYRFLFPIHNQIAFVFRFFTSTGYENVDDHDLIERLEPIQIDWGVRTTDRRH